MTLNELKKEMKKLGMTYLCGKKTVSRHELKVRSHYKVSFKVENVRRDYSVNKRGNITADDMRKLFLKELKEAWKQFKEGNNEKR